MTFAAKVALFAMYFLTNKINAYPEVIELPNSTEESINFYNYVCNAIKEKCFATIVFMEQDYCTAEMANNVIRFLSPCPVNIVNTQKIISNTQYTKWPKHIFVFINNFESFEEQLAYAKEHELWNPRAYIYFSICQPVDNTLWVNKTLKQIWQKDILHFTMSYYYKNFEVVSYNPFFDEIAYLRNYNKQAIYQNKLRNMNGYPLHVGFFADPPRIVEKNGTFYGIDAMIMMGFGSKFNATIKISNPGYANIIDEKFIKHFLQVYRRKCDFGFVSCFIIEKSEKESTVTYPRRMDGIVVLVPHASVVPQFLHMFMVFDRLTWIFICASLIAITICEYLKLKYLSNSVDLSKILLERWGLMLSVSGILQQKLFSNRLLLLVWIISFFILSSLFQSFFTSELITTRFEENIDTLAELKSKNMVIIINRNNARSIKEQYPQHLIRTWSEHKVLEMISKGDTSAAYAIQSSVAELISLKKTEDGYPVYHIIKELLIPGYTSYLFPVNSPYLDAANKYV